MRLKRKYFMIFVFFITLKFFIDFWPYSSFNCKPYAISDSSDEDLRLFDEWEPLGNTFYIRKNGSFYFEKEKKLRFLVITKIDMLKKIKVNLTLFNGIKMRNVSVECIFDMFLKSNNYCSCAIQCIMKIPIQRDTLMRLNVIEKQTGIQTRELVHVNMMRINKKPKNIVICTKMFNFTSSGFEMFQKWIEINKKLGYDKIVVYNHSITTEPYKQFIDSQNGFVELRPYKYLSHLDIERNLTGLNFEDLHSLKYAIQDIRRLHERIALNQCFMSNIYDYKRVAVFDVDEIIYPKRKTFINADSFSDNINNISGFIDNCAGNVVSYLDKLVEDKITPKRVNSFWFQYAHFMSISETRLFFDVLKKSLKNTKRYENNFQMDMFLKCDERNSKQITFQIKSISDYKYAKQLLSFYKNYYENGELERIFNKTLDHEFSRIFAIIGSHFLQDGYGKSIHVAQSPFRIGHHESFNRFLRHKVNYTYGYVSHFRNCLLFNNTRRFFNIKQIHVDFSYLNC